MRLSVQVYRAVPRMDLVERRIGVQGNFRLVLWRRGYASSDRPVGVQVDFERWESWGGVAHLERFEDSSRV